MEVYQSPVGNGRLEVSEMHECREDWDTIVRHVPIGVVQATFGWPLQSLEEKSFIKIVAKRNNQDNIILIKM